MPFKPVENPKCPKCGKSVYAAEERIAGGQKWHKTCFKCGMCNKPLDSTNCAEHEGEVFCKMCHGRKYGPKGYGFGGGAGCLSMDKGEHLGNTESESNRAMPEPGTLTKAPDGEGCPRCGGFVYAAEQMLARGRSWHRGCYKCGECKKSLDSMNCCEAPDRNIYCKVCYAKKFGPKGYGYGQGAGALQSDTIEVNGELFMPNRPRLINDTSVIKAPEGQGCPRCGGAVYAAEQKLSRGQEWHKKCFSCFECHKPLDSVLACDGPDKDVYCKTCYARRFGPKGYGFACGSGFLQTDMGPNDQGMPLPRPQVDTSIIQAAAGEGCPRCGGLVYAAEQMLAKGTMWHRRCFSCADCKRPLDSMCATDGPNREVFCRSCYGKRYGPKGFGFGQSPTLKTGDPDSIQVPLSDARPGPTQKAKEGEGCKRCGYVVFAAEQMISKGKVWHRRCFNCADCHRSLDSTNLNDAPDGDIYCRSCYGRKFGPRGCGFGIGAGALQMS